jgi:hypothetical protein
MIKNKYSIICAVNKTEVFKSNLCSSPDILKHDLLFTYDITNICKAYNESIDKSLNEILIFVHQDVFLPSYFFESLDIAIARLESVNWGVIGPAGRDDRGMMRGNILDRGNVWGNAFNLHAPVQTLDELCLVVKKSTFEHIMFDERITNQHLFGTDLCLQSLDKGFENFAVLSFCHHNSSQSYEVPKEFFETAEYLEVKWKDRLPIYSTCAVIGKDHA